MNGNYRVRAPGPTPIPEECRQAMAREPGYHRTEEFSGVIQQVVDRLQSLLDVEWPVLPLASSGTGAMEMAVQNTLTPGDTAVVIGGGKFGERWTRMVKNIGATAHEVDVEWGEPFDPEDVLATVKQHGDVDAVFGTAVETSTLVRHPVETLGACLKDRDVLFVVDAITAVGAEPFFPAEHGIDVVVLGAQKGLMGPPGLAFLGCSPATRRRARRIETATTYFDLPTAVDRLQKDSQTPWTPPIQLLRAQQCALERLFEEGLQSVYGLHESLARRCRRSVEAMGLELFAARPAVAGTAVRLPEQIDGERLHQLIFEKYRCFIPGGQKQWQGRLMRIGHLGMVDSLDLQQALSVLEAGLEDLGVTTGSSGEWLSAFREEGGASPASG